MQSSESLASLAPALVKALSVMPHPPKNATNPHLRNKFADLKATIDTTRPVLAEHGLTITQLTGGDGNNATVTTILMHESGEYVCHEAAVELPVAGKGMNDFQVAGSAYTYLRRYGWSAVCAVVADPDNDGNETKPEQQDQPQQGQKAEPRPAQPQQSAAPFNVETAKQSILTEMKGRGLSEATAAKLHKQWLANNVKPGDNPTRDQYKRLLQNVRQGVYDEFSGFNEENQS